MQLTLVTWNIRHGKGMDQKVDLFRIAAQLRDLEPDIVCLQEVDCRIPRSRFANQAARLGELMKMHHAFGPALRWPVGGLYGNAVLSRWEMGHKTVLRLNDKTESRAALNVQVMTPDGSVTVISTHWGLDAGDRATQGRTVADLVARTGDTPLLLAGDFNERHTAPGHEPLKEIGLQRLGPDEPTYPSSEPTEWIDHVYGTIHWSALNVIVAPTLASDHCPVRLELRAEVL